MSQYGHSLRPYTPLTMTQCTHPNKYIKCPTCSKARQKQAVDLLLNLLTNYPNKVKAFLHDEEKRDPKTAMVWKKRAICYRLMLKARERSGLFCFSSMYFELNRTSTENTLATTHQANARLAT